MVIRLSHSTPRKMDGQKMTPERPARAFDNAPRGRIGPHRESGVKTLDIGRDEPWPDIAMFGGVPHTLRLMTTAPTMGLYEIMKDEYPNYDDFLIWNQDFKAALDASQRYMVQYDGPFGRVWVKRRLS